MCQKFYMMRSFGWHILTQKHGKITTWKWTWRLESKWFLSKWRWCFNHGIEAWIIGLNIGQTAQNYSIKSSSTETKCIVMYYVRDTRSDLCFTYSINHHNLQVRSFFLFHSEEPATPIAIGHSQLFKFLRHAFFVKRIRPWVLVQQRKQKSK